jgi:nitroimidazol reductase NimA-like FMN-containing flavoprotein (pyridoxamine 5'-phosphate oxidase superfamily)
MHIEEMTTQECRAMLAGTHVARLACAVNNQPYIVPIHLAFDGEFFYGYSTLGHKIQWMRQNPLVCLEIDAVAGNQQWESVVVFGSYEELGTTPEYESSRRQAERLFQTRPMWWEPGSVPLNGRPPGAPIVFRIQLHRMTGRRAVPDVVTTEHLVSKMSQTSHAHASLVRYLLGGLLGFGALNAIAGGYYGLSGAEGVPIEWLDGSPFADYFIPSLILLVVVGGSFLIASIAVLAGRRISRTAAFAAGTIVLAWIAVQVAIIGYVSWMQPATAAAGVVVIVLAWLLPHADATRHG